MLAVAESIVAHHSLTVPAGLGIPGRGGEMYSAYYPLQSFLAAPFVGAAELAARLLHVPFHFIAAAFAGVLPALYTAASHLGSGVARNCRRPRARRKGDLPREGHAQSKARIIARTKGCGVVVVGASRRAHSSMVGRCLFACDGDLGLLDYFSRETLTALTSREDWFSDPGVVPQLRVASLRA